MSSNHRGLFVVGEEKNIHRWKLQKQPKCVRFVLRHCHVNHKPQIMNRQENRILFVFTLLCHWKLDESKPEPSTCSNLAQPVRYWQARVRYQPSSASPLDFRAPCVSRWDEMCWRWDLFVLSNKAKKKQKKTNPRLEPLEAEQPVKQILSLRQCYISSYGNETSSDWSWDAPQALQLVNLHFYRHQMLRHWDAACNSLSLSASLPFAARSMTLSTWLSFTCLV